MSVKQRMKSFSRQMHFLWFVILWKQNMIYNDVNAVMYVDVNCLQLFLHLVYRIHAFSGNECPSNAHQMCQYFQKHPVYVSKCPINITMMLMIMMMMKQIILQYSVL